MSPLRRLLFLAPLLASLQLHADTAAFTWLGFSGNGDTSTNANWAQGSAPTSASPADLIFGANASTFVNFDSDLTVNSLFIQSGYFFNSDFEFPATLTINNGLQTFSSSQGGGSDIFFNGGGGLTLNLGANQTWTVSSSSRLNVFSDITGAATLIKAGFGELALGGSNSFSGGVTHTDGTLTIASSTALGTGTLTINADNSDAQPVIKVDNHAGGSTTISNNLALTNGSFALDDSELTITGNVDLNSPNGQFALNNSSLRLLGNVANGVDTTNRSLALTGFKDGKGVLILGGNNTYTGGTNVVQGILVFGANSAIPATGALRIDSGAYMGIAFTGNTANFLSHLDPNATNGTIGFDTDPDSLRAGGAVNTFSDDIDLAALFGSSSSNPSLGSASSAILTGTITPKGQTYRFGGGGGFLQVDSAFVDGNGARSISVVSPTDTPLTLRITNPGNSLSGGLYVEQSAVRFTPAGLPTQIVANNWSMGPGGYIGLEFTPGGTNPTFASFLQRFNGAQQGGIIGVDTATNSQFSLTENIDLSGFTSVTDPGIYLGTSTNVEFTGSITLPGAQTDYRFAAYKGGTLRVHSQLTGSHGVIIGDPNVQGTFGDRNTDQISTVGLFNNANNYTGNTQFFAGRLLVGGGPGATTNVLGSGSLIIQPNNIFNTSDNDHGPLVLEAADDNLTIANSITLNENLQVSGTNALTLSGRITGAAGLQFRIDQQLFSPATANYTLSGNNTFSGGITFESQFNLTTNLHLDSDTGTGTGAIISNNNSDGTVNLHFNSAAPVIGGLAANSTNLHLLLGGTTTLTVNQQSGGNFQGTIDGVSGKLVKTGPGTLQLFNSSNTYGGGTDILSGTLAASSGALGTGTVTLNGPTASLLLNGGSNFTNALTLTQGTLGGFGTLDPSSGAITIGSGVTLSPGFDEFGGLGFLAFNVSLTLGPGGTYLWSIVSTNPGGPGVQAGFDNVSAGAGLTITASSANPFLITLGSPDDSGSIAGFAGNSSFNLPLIFSNLPISGFTGPDQFAVDASAFGSLFSTGTFAVDIDPDNSAQLRLNFIAVPEPSTYALLALGLGVIAVPLLRRRRS